jgi:type I restriction enzyme, S subunit
VSLDHNRKLPNRGEAIRAKHGAGDSDQKTALGWPETTLGAVFRLASGDTKPWNSVSVSSLEHPIPIYGGNGITGYTSISNASGRNIIIGRVGEYCGSVHYCDREIWITDNALFVRDWLQPSDERFYSYLLDWLDLRRLRNKGGQPLISQGPIYSLHVRNPSIAEQRSIALMLSTWDRAIGQTAALIAAKERLKQGLMQQLLSGRRRLPEFRHDRRQPTRLDAVFTKVARAVTVQPTTFYREIGIRSHGKGIFHKEPVEGHELGNKRVYEVVPGCLTLNIVFAWERALAVTTRREARMIASHRFPMFQPDPERVAVDFVLHFLLSDVGHDTLKLASPGGAGRNRTISQEQFLKTIVPLPSIAEQRKIVAVINAAEEEIAVLRRHLQALKTQKRGLMQQMLTGRVRVPKSLLTNEGKS